LPTRNPFENLSASKRRSAAGSRASGPRHALGAGALEFHDALDDAVELRFGLVADEPADFFERGHAALHVLEALLVRLIVRNVHDGRTAAAGPQDALRQLADGDLLVAPQVEHLAARGF